MFDILLQVDTTVVTTAAAPKAESLFSILAKGGMLMIPLMALLGIAIYFFIERLLIIRNAAKIDDNFMNIIRDHILSGNVTAARSLAKNTNNPVSRVIYKGIQRIGKPIDAIEKSMSNVGVLEMYKLEKNLPIISNIARIAPLFGFLGTIIGMLALFKDIAATANVALNVIADGIYIKMITSATGLIIGILAYLGYSFLQTQISRIENKMDAAGADFVDVLQEPTK